MLASRFGKLSLTLTVIAFVVIGGSALAAPHAAAVNDAADTTAATVARGVVRAVDATIGDSSKARASQSERQAPRTDDLPYLLPLAIFAIALAYVGTTRNRVPGSTAAAPLRDGIGRRAPPALVAP